MKKHAKFFMLITFLAVTLFCPASSKADTVAHAIWGTGIQIGWAEMGAYQGVDPRTLVQSLAYARDMARQTGCLPPDEIERLRVAMSQTRDSRMLYQRISSYRQGAYTYLQRCRCAGGGNAAWALWGLGVQIGWAEMASYYGIDPRTVLQALTSARDHARQISCINTRKIDELIMAMYEARNSRELYQQITSYRQQQLLSEVQRNCSCGAGGLPDLNGLWLGERYTCNRNTSSQQQVRIQQTGQSVVATKITGDDCVGAGYITWRGTYTSNRFAAQFQIGLPGQPKSFVPVTVEVKQPNLLIISGSGLSMTYRRN